MTINNIELLNTRNESILFHQIKERSKPTYIKFWASWCIPCNQQMPHFEQAYKQYGDKVTFISVNLGVNDSLQDVKNIVDKYQLTMNQYVDNSGDLAHYFDLVGTPYHVLLTKDGHIKFVGHDANEQLDDHLAALANGASSNTINSVAKGIDENTKKQYQTGRHAVLMTSTWCHSYLKESRPESSTNCLAANKLINELAQEYKEFQWSIITSRLLTGNNELEGYKAEYKLQPPAFIDTSNELFLEFNVTNFPTLLILEDGKQTLRIEDFENKTEVYRALGRI